MFKSLLSLETYNLAQWFVIIQVLDFLYSLLKVSVLQWKQGLLNLGKDLQIIVIEKSSVLNIIDTGLFWVDMVFLER